MKNNRKLIRQLPSTSELAFGLMINLQRNIIQSFNSVKNKRWDYSPFIGNELASLTIGIVGLGRLGNLMAKFAQAFGMKVFIMILTKKQKNIKK